MSNIIFSYEVTLKERLIHALVPVFIISSIMWIVILATLQEFLLKSWAPPERAALALKLTIPVGLYWGWFRFSTRIHGLKVFSNTMVLLSKRNIPPFPLNDLKVALGIGGVSLNGGDIFNWKKLVLITNHKNYILNFEPSINSDIYYRLLESSPKLTGIPYPITHIDRVEILYPFSSIATSVFLRSALSKLLVGSIILIPIIIVGIVLASKGNPEYTSGMGNLVIFTIIATALICSSVNDFIISHNLQKLIFNNSINHNYEVQKGNSDLFNERKFTVEFFCKKCNKEQTGIIEEQMKTISFSNASQSPELNRFIICNKCKYKNPTKIDTYIEGEKISQEQILKPISLLGKVVAILSLLFCYLPFFGIILALVAFLQTNRSQGFFKIITYISLILSLISSTTFFLYKSM